MRFYVGQEFTYNGAYRRISKIACSLFKDCILECSNCDKGVFETVCDDGSIGSAYKGRQILKIGYIPITQTPIIQKGEGTMNKTISKVFAKAETQDALLVDKHFSGQIREGNILDELALTTYQSEVLSRAKALEDAESKGKE